jgi:hypothetical protein
MDDQFIPKAMSPEIGSERSDLDRCYPGYSWTRDVPISTEIMVVETLCRRTHVNHMDFDYDKISNISCDLARREPDRDEILRTKS